VGGYTPRAPEESVRQRRLVGAPGRPLNFTVRLHWNMRLRVTLSASPQGHEDQDTTVTSHGR
jgi:hypothetical protein